MAASIGKFWIEHWKWLTPTIIGICTLLFGRGWIPGVFNKKHQRQVPVIDECLDLIGQYHDHAKMLQEIALKHQGGGIEGGVKDSRNAFGDQKHKLGNSKNAVCEMLSSLSERKDLIRIHAVWCEAIFTDCGLCATKNESKSSNEISLMESTFKDLEKHIRSLKIRCKTRECAVKSPQVD